MANFEWTLNTSAGAATWQSAERNAQQEDLFLEWVWGRYGPADPGTGQRPPYASATALQKRNAVIAAFEDVAQKHMIRPARSFHQDQAAQTARDAVPEL